MSLRAFPWSAPERGFISREPASLWEEGLICGNGTIGLVALSRTQQERIIVTHERHFMPMGQPMVPADQSAHLPEIRRLIREGKYQEAAQRQFDLSCLPGFRYPDFFVPCCDLVIETATSDNPLDYRRGVDFRTGEAAIAWRDEDTEHRRSLFVSRRDGIAVIRLSTARTGMLNCRLTLAAREPSDEFNPDSDIHMRSDECFDRYIHKVVSRAGDDWLSYRHEFTQAYPGSIVALECRARVVRQGGHATALPDGTLAISGADEILILLDLRLPRDFSENAQRDMARALANVNTNYAILLAAQAEEHAKVFGRMRLDLGGGPDHGTCTEDLLAASSIEHLHLALLEKQFDAGRHNILSSSGQLPPNLQGLWGGTYVPGWASDYTHNGNVPSAIAANHQGNMPELMEGYFSYLESLLPDMECNARHFFGARGIVLPSRSSTHGLNHALAPEFAGGMWVCAAAWAAHFFHDHFLFTGDRDFLARRALPFMEKAVAFFEDYLTEGEDGYWNFSPTQSPENTPGNTDSQATFNATMDVAAAKELLHNMISASHVLAVNHDHIPRWQKMLEKMPPYLIDERGIIKEWLTPLLENNDRHRHASQFYPLYHGMPEEIAQNAPLREAFRRGIQYKLDEHWGHDSRGYMSFGLIQLGQAAASLGDGELALRCLKHLSHRFWLANLASMHNHRSLLNMDISGGMPAVILQMLVSSRAGRIDLLPALPDEWKSGTLEGALCRGEVELKRLHWCETRIEAALISSCDQSLEIHTPRVIKHALVSGVPHPADGKTLTLDLTADDPVGVVLAWMETSAASPS